LEFWEGIVGLAGARRSIKVGGGSPKRIGNTEINYVG
jgi:hypothetical protein